MFRVSTKLALPISESPDYRTRRTYQIKLESARKCVKYVCVR